MCGCNSPQVICRPDMAFNCQKSYLALTTSRTGVPDTEILQKISENYIAVVCSRVDIVDALKNPLALC